LSTIGGTLGGELAVTESLERFGLRALPRCPVELESALIGLPVERSATRDSRVLLRSLRSMRVIEEGLAAGTVPALRKLLDRLPSAGRTDPAAARLAALWINRLIVLRHGWNPCFYHCSGIVAGLRSQGHDAQFVVGHERTLLPGSPGPMHSWVEVDGRPVNESPRTVHSYRIVMRLPRATG
jgi:Transglutaminase-like superfamily